MADKKQEATWTTQINLSKSLDDENTINITKEGLKNYKAELKKLIEIDRPGVQNSLKEARAQGDLSENADYDAAKEKQSETELRIQELEDIISRVKIIDTSHGNAKIVELGEIITIIPSNTKKELKVQIVGSIESDPLASPAKISSNSPLGQALLGASLGEEVKMEKPKKYYVEIKKIASK